jgi:hypothetical protein
MLDAKEKRPNPSKGRSFGTHQAPPHVHHGRESFSSKICKSGGWRRKIEWGERGVTPSARRGTGAR